MPVLVKALAATGLLDPVSANSGARVSENILHILIILLTVPPAMASTISLPLMKHSAECVECPPLNQHKGSSQP